MTPTASPRRSAAKQKHDKSLSETGIGGRARKTTPGGRRWRRRDMAAMTAVWRGGGCRWRHQSDTAAAAWLADVTTERRQRHCSGDTGPAPVEIRGTARPGPEVTRRGHSSGSAALSAPALCPPSAALSPRRRAVFVCLPFVSACSATVQRRPARPSAAPAASGGRADSTLLSAQQRHHNTHGPCLNQR